MPSATIAAASQLLIRALKISDSKRPRLGIILGSGLGDFAETLTNSRRIPFSSLPDFPASTIEGHSGNFVLGELKETPIICVQGRIHYYEGHAMSVVTHPVRLLAGLGIKYLVLTNAAGGINRRLKPGDLMVVRDHISLFVPNPLIGPNDEKLGPRFPDMSQAYSPRLIRMAKGCARRLNLTLREGIYVSVPGPSYESPAEIRMLQRAGADAVGMSTVPEVLVARHLGLECLGISLIANLAAGLAKKVLSHRDVLAAGQRARPRFMELLTLLSHQILTLE